MKQATDLFQLSGYIQTLQAVARAATELIDDFSINTMTELQRQVAWLRKYEEVEETTESF